MLRCLDSYFPKLCVGIVLVDLLSRSIQWSVLLVLALHTLVRFVLLSLVILLYKDVGVGVNRDEVIEVCV